MIEFIAGSDTGHGYLARPTVGSGPGVLVLHAWWGLNDAFRGVADRLAAAGFLAFAPDLFDGQIATTTEDAQTVAEAHEGDPVYAMVPFALERLASDPDRTTGPMAVIGFSFGAWYSLWLVRQRPELVKAAIVVYGLGLAPVEPAAVQVHRVPDDQFDADADYQELLADLRAGGHRFEAIEYPGTKHWFIEPDRPEYDAAAAELLWERVIAFLHAEIGGGS
jgi:carboxymethylenebutenolidase